jgi:subfamily B ATP-binding cassette protein MsbA
LLAAPALIGISCRYAPRVRRSAKMGRTLVSRWFDLAEERIGALALIHAFDAHRRETERFAARCDAARAGELRTVKIEAGFALLLELATAFGGILVIGFGAYQIIQGSLTVGTLVAFACPRRCSRFGPLPTRGSGRAAHR